MPIRSSIIHFLQSYCSLSDYHAKSAGNCYHETMEYTYSFLKNKHDRRVIHDPSTLISIVYGGPYSLIELGSLVSKMIQQKINEEASLEKDIR